MAARRRPLIAVIALGLAAGAGAPTPASAQPAPPALALTHGVASGDATDDGAVIWARANRTARMRVIFGTEPDDVGEGRGARSSWAVLRGARDFTGRVRLAGLRAGSVYFYRVQAYRGDERAQSAIASFTTPPSRSRAADVDFAWGADVGQGLANRPPFPAFAAIADEAPDFFLFNGDTVYADSITPAGPGAATRPEYWAKYKENRADPLFQALARETSLVVNWDDHEVANDYRGPTQPLLPIGRAAFHDYWPLSVGPERVYRSLRWGRELELFVIDARQYADPLAEPDGPEKTMLGAEQRRWIEEAVRRSDATWKVIATSTPLSIQRSAEPPHDDWVSYETELRGLLESWRTAGLRNLVWLTADVHWGQAIEYPEWSMWEFVGAPIGANPRAVASPLSPTFGPRSAFLALDTRLYGSVSVDAPARRMTVTLKDETGAPLHREVLPAR